MYSFQEQLEIVAGEEGALLQPGSRRPGKSIKMDARETETIGQPSSRLVTAWSRSHVSQWHCNCECQRASSLEASLSFVDLVPSFDGLFF